VIRFACLAGLSLAAAACGTVSSAGAPSTGSRDANLTDGTLVRVSGSALVLSTSSGDVTVDVTGSTPITDTSMGSVADITVGSCITASGSADGTGLITATNVTVSMAVNGICAAGPSAIDPGGFPGGRPDFTFRPRETPSGFTPDFTSVRGMVTAVSGAAVTVQETSGISEGVTLPTTARVSTSTPGSPSDLVAGACVAAIGPRGSSGTVTARSLLIEPTGPSGCFTGSSGFGGYGGGGFGGFGGAGSGTTTTT